MKITLKTKITVRGTQGWQFLACLATPENQTAEFLDALGCRQAELHTPGLEH